MGRFIGKILLLVLLLSPMGCITELFSTSAGYDSRSITVQSLSLFNQRSKSRFSKKNWKGDWIFRRDRLEMIDRELRNSKPDVLLLQELLERKSNPFESDKSILEAGSLNDYKWRYSKVAEHDDTNEIEYMGVVAGGSISLADPEPLERTLWLMGKDGYLMATEVEVDGEPAYIFNVHMPPATSNDYLWYSFVEERVLERIRAKKLCPKRIVVGGYLPGDQGSERFQKFVKTLGLKDASTGFCQIASRCFTATPTNEIFMATQGDEVPSRTDRIFLHSSAIVYSSTRNLAENDPNNRYAKMFGINRLWPTERFGWTVSTRLARCHEDQMGQEPANL